MSLEERLASMSPEEKEEEQKKIGAQSALTKITQAGYSSLDVGRLVPLHSLGADMLSSAHPVLHLRSSRSTGVDDSKGDQGTSSRRCHPVLTFLLPIAVSRAYHPFFQL